MKKLLFLHGFFASGGCPMAITLRDGLRAEAEVLTPDLPLSPNAALDYIRAICKEAHPDILVGNSCGSFYAQIIANEQQIPALLGNPYFEMTKFLAERIGSHKYKSPRKDGRQDFEITDDLVSEFQQVQDRQFRNLSPSMASKIWGIFGDSDPIAHYESLFLAHYSRSFHFPGAHTPTADEVCEYYLPVVREMMRE